MAFILYRAGQPRTLLGTKATLLSTDLSDLQRIYGSNLAKGRAGLYVVK